MKKMWELSIFVGIYLKPPQIAPKIALFDPNFTFRSPKSHKNDNGTIDKTALVSIIFRTLP